MSSSKPAPIAIVGGGPCGLTFARLLECAGIDYVVFERDASSVPEPGFQGGTLDIHGQTGQEALRRAGLHGEFEKLARRDATSLLVQNYKGDFCMKFGEKRDAPEIDRLQLRQILLDSLPSHRVRWGKTLASLERDTHQGQLSAKDIILHFTDGSTATGFRIVVGADGAWSKVRQLVSWTFAVYSSNGILIVSRLRLRTLNTQESFLSRADYLSTIHGTMLHARWLAQETPLQ
jgi:2-polyprenyl-6-methoxyphenol hydroxylase-like FAD-dependent oxidoreductase